MYDMFFSFFSSSLRLRPIIIFIYCIRLEKSLWKMILIFKFLHIIRGYKGQINAWYYTDICLLQKDKSNDSTFVDFNYILNLNILLDTTGHTNRWNKSSQHLPADSKQTCHCMVFWTLSAVVANRTVHWQSGLKTCSECCQHCSSC